MWVNRGFLYGPLFPMYGCVAVYLVVFLDNYKNNIFFSVLSISILEYFTGFVLEKAFKVTSGIIPMIHLTYIVEFVWFIL